MSICCYDLLSLKNFKNIKLIAGKNGLYRQVTWPYICTTSTISQWVHGGELVFITGAGFDPTDDNLISLMDECIQKSLAGIVLVSGYEHFIHVSDRLKQYSEENNIPIFVMDWNTRIIDVTQEISELIIKRRDQFYQSQLFLDRLLFSDGDDTSLYELYDLYNISNKPFRFISVFNIVSLSESYNSIHYIKNDLINYLYQQCDNKVRSLIALESSNTIICLASVDKIQTIDSFKEAINNVFIKISKRYQDSILMYLGVGRVYMDGTKSKIKQSFKEAQRSISLMKKGLCEGNILFYDDAGIYKILYEIKNDSELKAYYDSNIGKIIESDIKNAGNLVDTLRSYLNNNGSLVNTAQDLFIHRNTLIYRLNTIKEVLQKDLNNSSIRFQLYMSILAYDFQRSNINVE